MRNIIWIIAFALLATVAYVGFRLPLDYFSTAKRRAIVGRVGDKVITDQDLSLAMRAHIWRQGKTWANMGAVDRRTTQDEVLQELIIKHLVRLYRKDAALPQVKPETVSNELTYWKKQFQQDSETEARLSLQELTEVELEAEIRDQQFDAAWLELQTRVTVTEDEVTAWYNQYKDTLRIPKSYHVAHIFLSKHDPEKPQSRGEEIREIFHKFVSGKATFEELVSEYSEDDRTKTKGGDLGWFTANRMPEEFITNIKNMRPGQVGQPFPTRLGYHIVQLISVKDPELPPLDVVRSEIETVIANEKRQNAMELFKKNLVQKAEAKGLLQTFPNHIANVVPPDSAPSPQPNRRANETDS